MTKFVEWWTGKVAPLVYHMTVDTKEFINSSPADPSPMEPGVWLLPGHATWIKPPDTDEHEAVVFKDDKWRKVPDYRGEVRYHNGDFVQIITLGEPLDPPMVVKDAEFFLPDGNMDRDGAMIRMWINDDVIEFRDDPELMARRVLAGWEAQGETIRSVSYDKKAFEPVVDLSEDEIAQANLDAAAALEAMLDERVEKMLEQR